MSELTHHPGLTNEAYHALKAVSPSQIKVLGRSPLHYFDQFLAEDREKREPPPVGSTNSTRRRPAMYAPRISATAEAWKGRS